MNASKVICLGAATIDIVFEVDEIPRQPVKRSARSRTTRGGGPAGTAAVACAILGGDAHLWGYVGRDTEGDTLRAMLAQRGVQTEGLLAVGGSTMVAVAIVDPNGERLIFAYGHADKLPPLSQLPLESLDGAAAVVADCVWPEAALALFGEARKRRIPSVLDAETLEEQALLPLLAASSIPVISEEVGRKLCGGEVSPLRLNGISALSGDFGVTLGSSGSLWRIDGTYKRVGALPVKPVDTTGAGDVFHGAFALGLAEGMTVETAARFATSAAGLKCAAGNGWEGMPARHDVERSIAELTFIEA